MIEDDDELVIEDAAERMLEAEISRGVRTWMADELIAAVLAIRARQLSEYICGVNIAIADRERQRASGLVADATRRRPGGRRVYTRLQIDEQQARAAERIERADAAESEAIRAVSAADLAAARAATAHVSMDAAPADGRSLQQEWAMAYEVAELFRRRRRRRERWHHVRGRAEQSAQPRGGVLPLTLFERHQFGGELLPRTDESGPAGTIGSTVELLARWDLARDLRAAADPLDATIAAIRAVRRGEHSPAGPAAAATASTLRSVADDEYDEYEWREEPADTTLEHIIEMRARVSRLFEHFGPPVQPGTWRVSSERFLLSGYIDFVTATTIWDLKVSATAPAAVDVLQLLLYWASLKEDPTCELEITSLGLYNPRLDTAWLIAVSAIPSDVVEAVEALALRSQP